MQFKIIKDGDSIRKHNIDILKTAVTELKEGEDYFVIIEPQKPISNSIYMQVTLNGGVYQVEIRFITDDGGESFRHYSNQYKSQEEVFSIVKNYYLEERIPDLKGWTDCSSSFTDEPEDNMVKLYKKTDGQIQYFEVWLNEDNTITSHSGTLGDVGETENLDSDSNDGLPVKVQMDKLIFEARQNGYEVIDDMTELVIQFSYSINDARKDVEQEVVDIESIVNNCLGWTGNGHCDGWNIDAGKVNMFCFVMDKDIAVETITDEVESGELLNDLRIAFLDEQSGEFLQIYPDNGRFTL